MKVFCLALVAAALVVPTLSAQTFKVLHSFTNAPDGRWPRGALICVSNQLYGTTYYGGSCSNGTIFAVGVDGSGYQVLHSFSAIGPYSSTNYDGANSEGGLVFSEGTLYGTARNGGAAPWWPNGFVALGTVFAMDIAGKNWTTLKSFRSSFFGEATHPVGSLIVSGDRLYGTAYGDESEEFGAVFAVNTNGTGLVILHKFGALPDGRNPMAGLVLSGSTLYGTTSRGGNLNNAGTVFKINVDGTGYSVLKVFSPQTDGQQPTSGLTLSGDTLFGTTTRGSSNGWGSVFSLKTDGTDFRVLRALSTQDGTIPAGGLVLSGTTLYGTAKFGGLGGVGTIFKLNTDGTDFSVLKHFPSYRSDGALPTQSLTLDGDTLYGVTEAGGDPAGTPGHGVIFSLTLPRSSPQVQVTNPGFTGQSVSFGFQMAGPPGLGVVVEASTELTATNWVPLETNVLGTTPLQFLDKTATNYPRRYYRLRIQE